MSYRLKLFIFSCALFIAPAFSQAQTRSIISNLANPAIGFNALFLGQVAPELNQPYGLQFQESELGLVSTVDSYWTLTANLVFAPDEVTPEEVYVTNANIPNIQLKLGKFKGAFGKHGLLHTHAFPFIQAPVVMANTIGGEGFGDVGLEVGWLTPLSWYCELTLGAYQAVVSDSLDLGASNHDNIPYLAHLKNQFDLDDDTTMELGGSFLNGNGTDGAHHTAYGMDLTFRNVPAQQSNQRGWILQGEYLARDTWNNDGSFGGHQADGWYASFQYRWSQVWWSGIRVEEAFHSGTEMLDQVSPGLAGHVQKLSANVAWVPSEFSVIRAEYSVAKEDPDDLSGAVWDHRFMVQLNYTIGFHPPHAY